jgi:hypothetical protein
MRFTLPAGNHDCTISGAAGIKFVGFNDGTLTFVVQDAVWDFNTQCPIAIVYWNGSAIVAAPQTEYHGIRDTIWHAYTHQFLGLQYRSGLVFTGSVQADTNADPGATETVYNLWSTTGTVQDEDFGSSPGTGQWAQTLGSGLTTTTAAILPFFYYNGSAVTSNAAMADRAPFIHPGANTPPRWENAGVLTASVTGDYIVYHYFVTPMVGGWSIFSRPHNAKYASLAAALAASPTQLTWSNYAEVKHIYTAVFRVNTNWANSHRCKLVSLRDFRLIAASPTTAISPTAHASLSGLELAGAGATWGHIDDQAQTIAGAKTFTSHPLSTDADVPAGNELIPMSKLGQVVEALSNKATLVAGDRVLLSDSADSNNAKEALISAISTYVRTGITTLPSSGHLGEILNGTPIASNTTVSDSGSYSAATINLNKGSYILRGHVVVDCATGSDFVQDALVGIMTTAGIPSAPDISTTRYLTETGCAGAYVIVNIEKEVEVTSDNTTFYLRLYAINVGGTGVSLKTADQKFTARRVA